MKKDMRKSLALSSIIHASLIAALIMLKFGGSGTGQGNGEDESKNEGKFKQEQYEVDIIPPPNDKPEEFVPEESEAEKLKKVAPHSDDDCTYFYGGIGVQQAYGPNGYFIESVFPGYPADKAGMKAGDVLVTLNEIRGEVGTSVSVTINRNGQDITFNMTRDKICTSEPKNKGAKP